MAISIGAAVAAAQEQPVDATRRRAAELALDLQYDESLALLRTLVATAPADPAAHRALANVVWLQVLFLRGAVTCDHYLGSFNSSQVTLDKPPPALDAEFRSHAARAVALAEARVAAAPRDPQARYELGAAVGLQSSYLATIDGKMLAGFRSARRAYDEHERVQQLDPARKDAGLIVGTYRYVISTLSAPMRLMAYAAGFGGGRDRGLAMIEEAAAAGGDNRPEAMFALVLMYNRERRYDRALAVLEELRTMYPRNRLILLEAGATALRGGDAATAERLLTEGLRRLDATAGPRIPGEEALWRYKRGAARVALGRTDALDDLKMSTTQAAQTWVKGRAHAELARAALARGDRATAEADARRSQSLCQQGNDPLCAAEAATLLRSARGR